MKKTIRDLFLLSLLAGLASCASDDLLYDSVNDSVIQHITVTLPAVEVEEEVASTRNQFINMGTADWNAVWAEGDTLGIFPSSGGQVEFAVTEFGSNTSVFDGGGWALKSAVTYAAYYPFDKHNVYVTNKTIPLDYTGQVQQGNGSYDHLGSYDFLASKAMPRSGNSLNFELLRQGYVICLNLTVPETDTYTEIDLVTDGTPFVTKAELDITSTTAPAVTAKEKSNTIRLGLEDVTVSANGTLTAYMMAFPVGNVTPRVVLHGKNGTYEGVVNKVMNLTRNKMAIRSATLTGATMKNLYLIAAAEANDGVDLTNYKDGNGFVDVNAARAMLEKVESIVVNGKNDPTICDEIGYFPNLETLNCASNKITSLDLSKNLKLKELRCGSNNLYSLNVTNHFYLEKLSCDNNYISHLDVTHCSGLKNLTCSAQHNQLTSLDVSYNHTLEQLYCQDNALQSLDLSYNPFLKSLACGDNELHSLDVSNNQELTYLSCYNAALSSLDVSANTKLTDLYCQKNSLISLDLTKNTALKTVYCYENSLRGLEVTKCTELEDLECGDNNLTTLDVQYNTKLTTLMCANNKLTNLKLNKNAALVILHCGGNNLTSLTLDLRNENKNLMLLSIEGSAKLKVLSCYGSEINNGNLYTLNVKNCPALEELYCSYNPHLSSLDLTADTRLKFLSIANCNFSDLNITNNTALLELYCGYNKIKDLNVSQNTLLQKLSCAHNELSRLNLTNNTKLTSLLSYDNLMRSLDIKSCTSLTLDKVECGRQWQDATRTTGIYLSLLTTSSNTGTLPNTGPDGTNSRVY